MSASHYWRSTCNIELSCSEHRSSTAPSVEEWGNPQIGARLSNNTRQSTLKYNPSCDLRESQDTKWNFYIMGKNINFTDNEWQTIYASVHREYERQLREKILDDTSSGRWLDLLLKILAHIDCDELDKKSRN